MPERKGTLFFKRTQVSVTLPDGTKKSYPLGDVTRIGRGKENQIPLPEDFKSISRQHLEIRHEELGYHLFDLGSGNGIAINGNLVNDALLNDRDEIIIGLSDMGQQVQVIFQLGTELALSG